MRIFQALVVPAGIVLLTVITFALLTAIGPNPNLEERVAASFLLAMVVGFGATVYMLPAVISGFRGSPKFGLIVLVNVLSGWSLIGWVVSLVWAAIDKEPPKQVIIQQIFQHDGAPPPLPPQQT